MKDLFVNKKPSLIAIFAMSLLAVTFSAARQPVYAATTIVVNSTADTTADDGACTLREAIRAANNDTASGATAGECAAGSGADTINFDILPLNGSVKTISPSSALPSVSEQLTIDGYTQDDAAPNTNRAPQALNTELRIVINGASAGTSDGLSFDTGSDGSILRGVAINGFNGVGVAIASNNVKVEGSFIGTDANGLTGITNTLVGVSIPDNASNITIGGSAPDSRNLISGNSLTGIQINGTGNEHIDIAGNLIGLDRLGLSAIPNGFVDGNGIGIYDHSTISNVTIGGPNLDYANVISGNSGKGVDTSLAIVGLTVEHNYIGVGVDGKTDIGNVFGMQVAGGAVIKSNVISGNDTVNVIILGTNNVVQSNYIGTSSVGNVENGIDQGAGVVFAIGSSGSSNNLVGGANSGEGNIVAGNSGAGIVGSRYYVSSVPMELSSEGNSVLGNNIFSNKTGSFLGNILPGLGIDHYTTDFDGSFNPIGATDIGPNLNDIGDADAGANNYINFPVLNSVTQDGSQATIDFSLDAADSPTNQYRVEFFANDAADPSGYGEGQTFLGYATVGNGNNQEATLTLPTGTNLTGKSISATTTAIDATTSSGFGSTSEFSLVKLASVTSVSSNPGSTGSSTASGTLANTGEAIKPLIAIAIALVIAGNTMIFKRRKGIFNRI